MDKRLVEAARAGDVTGLYKLWEEDPQILEKSSLALFVESPLHIAALAGKEDFVKEIVTQMPSLVSKPNEKGLIPLHMASAQGHIETVRELLEVKLDDKAVNQCLLKEYEGRTPLHFAVSNGKVEVIKELISHCSECLKEVTAKGETVLHLAVKANQFKAAEVLVKEMKEFPYFETLFGAKDNNRKTVYELAAAKKQFQVILDIGNSVAVDIKDGEAEASKNEEEKDQKKSEFQNAVLVVATVIISLTYQGLLNPPTSTILKQGTEIQGGCVKHGHFNFKPMNPIKFLKHCPMACSFLFFNSLIFITSIMLVVSTLRGRRILFLRLVTFYLTVTYAILLEAFSFYFAASFAVIAVIFWWYIMLRDEDVGKKLLLRIVRLLIKKVRERERD